MTVEQLIKELSQCEPTDLVVMSKDGEGNGYSPLAEIDTNSAYSPESTWAGEIGLRKVTPSLRKQGYSSEDLAPKDAKPCVVLWPIN